MSASCFCVSKSDAELFLFPKCCWSTLVCFCVRFSSVFTRLRVSMSSFDCVACALSMFFVMMVVSEQKRSTVAESRFKTYSTCLIRSLRDVSFSHASQSHVQTLFVSGFSGVISSLFRFIFLCSILFGGSSASNRIAFRKNENLFPSPVYQRN